MWRGKALSHGVNLGLADKDDHGLHGAYSAEAAGAAKAGWVRIKRRRREGFCLLVFQVEKSSGVGMNRILAKWLFAAANLFFRA
jgi:hypothetical protein